MFTTKLYDTAGTYTWVAPAGITKLLLFGHGGGGGGGGAGTLPASVQPPGGSGCSSALKVIDVVPGTSYTITVGAGGTGGPGVSDPNTVTAGGTGGDTIFTDGASLTVTLKGAAGAPVITSSNYTLPGLYVGPTGMGGLGGIAGYYTNDPSSAAEGVYSGDSPGGAGDAQGGSGGDGTNGSGGAGGSPDSEIGSAGYNGGAGHLVLLWSEDLNIATKTFATGSSNWTAPAGVSLALLMGRGGGGGGGGRNPLGASSTCGSGGGGGSCSMLKPVFVTPGTLYTITIGAGGAPGANSTSGSPGGDTTFGSLATFKGGLGGYAISAAATTGRQNRADIVSFTLAQNGAYPAGSGGRAGTIAGVVGSNPGSNSPFANGGIGSSSVSTDGGGGGAGDGPGGAGCTNTVYPGGDGIDGGGGGGGQRSNGTTHGGGTGGNGQLTIIWFE